MSIAAWIIGGLSTLLALIGSGAALYRKGKKAGSEGEALSASVREFAAKSKRAEIRADKITRLEALTHEELIEVSRARIKADRDRAMLESERRKLEGKETMDIKEFDRRLDELEKKEPH